jgi:hypothetical protein
MLPREGVMLAILVSVALGAELPLWSPSQPAPVHDESDVFSGVRFDTGWWPNKGDVVAVRFHITPTGEVFTDIDADSELAWPDTTLEHRLVALPDTGSFRADATIDVEAEVSIDIFGLYNGVIDLWSEQLSFSEEELFDGLLLLGGPGREVSLHATDAGVSAIDYAFSVIPGLSLVSTVDLYPELEASMEGVEVRSHFGVVQLEQIEELQWEHASLPTQPTPEQLVDITWVGDLDAALNLVIEPAIELDTIFGDFELLSIPLDVEITSVQQRREAETQSVVHPLPALGEVMGQHGFGEVELGQERSLQVPVPNLGELMLEGTAHIEGGDGALSVYPDTLVARAADEDGLIVTFAPSVEGLHEAELVLLTNAPEAPEVRIPLTGIGWVEPPPVTTPTTPSTTDPTVGTTTSSTSTASTDQAPDSVNSEDLKGGKGCGCTSAPTGATGWLFLAALSVVGLRRGAARRT